MLYAAHTRDDLGVETAPRPRAPRRSSLRLRVPDVAPTLVWSSALGAELQRMVTGLRYSLWILLDHAERGCAAPREFAVEQVRVAHHLEAVLAALQAGGEPRSGAFDLWPLLHVVAAAQGSVRITSEHAALLVVGRPADAALLLDAVLAPMVGSGVAVRVGAEPGAMRFECAPGESAAGGLFDEEVRRRCERLAGLLGMAFFLALRGDGVSVTLRVRPLVGRCRDEGSATQSGPT